MRNLLSLTNTLFFFAFFLLSNSTQGQTIAWNFTAGTATPSTTSPTIATSSDLVQGNNNGTTTFVTTTSASSGYAGASGTFNAGLAARIGALNTAASGSAYVEFTLTPVSGQTVTLTAISFGTRSTSTGAQAYTLRSSLDAYASDIATGTIANTSTWSLKTNTGLSVVSGIGTAITFRIYGYNGTGAPSAGTANWRLDDLILSVLGASTNADLSNLTLSSGTLSPVFASATTSYTASVANAVTSITVTPTAANANSTITVNGNAVTSGSPSGSIALAEGPNVITTVVTAQDAVTTKTYTVTVTRAAAGVATVSITTSLPDFGAVCINTTTSASSFKITGTDLNGSNIDLAALPGFTYCETVGGTYATTLSFTYTAPGFTDKEIFVKFNPTAVQSYNGNIILSGGGLAANVPVPASGSGVNTTLVITTGASTPITATSGTPAGIINIAGCTAITAYGIEYSTTSAFPDGTGTKINATNLSGTNYSVTLTGLIPNTRYYYKAYATVDGGITYTYGLQQAFNCLPLAVPMIAQSNLTFTETFSDIANWSDFFITGTGANHWDGLSNTATQPATGIPSPIIFTAATNQFQTPFTPGTNITSGGVQKGSGQLPPIQSIVLLSTFSPDNNTATALDFYMDFTGVNAGTLSFDYETLNNATGDRNGSLRVYATIDGITYTELTFANVLNFTNNIPISGSKTNIALPASFNNNANAILRFYYHNGSGGTGTGSRPKISIDNLKITAVATTPCVAPTAPATGLNFGTITDVSIAGSFTAASPATDGYMVVVSVNSSLTSSPVNGTIYNIGDNLGDGTVIANGSATTFTATGLTPLTNYYFFVFPVNSICTGGPLYFGTSLDGNTSTVAGLPPCAAPAGQPLNYVAATTTVNTIQASFTATTANEYLVLRTTTPPLTNNPVDAVVYNAGDILGNAVVVQRSAATSFTATGLLPNTTYNFYVFALNSQACVNGPVYNITAPLQGIQATQPLPLCTTPSAQPTVLTLTPANTSVAGTFTGVVDADDYLVVISSSSTLSASPVDNTDYTVGNNFGGGTVIANSANTSFLATGLTPNTLYYFFVFAANKTCTGGTKYVSANPLTGNTTTTNTAVNNFYFGNLHAHSDYSDGNTDNPGYTPAQDYDYAMTAECMDFLGISEHNHFDAETVLSNYHLGVSQATTFSNAHPNFLALYGMEWGTISTGGHVLIYGNGMDDLWGWQSGAGGWGGSNNYDVYVPKGTYTGATGVFKTTNDNIATNTFVTLAHPGLGDFNNLDAIAYDVAADNAIVATAVESGPSTSSNTTYSNPASSMGYLWYYQTLLAKGYHLGPTVDHDNHKTTFGKTTRSRTAVIASGPTLTKAAMMTAMRNMNFYATQDCDTKVDFSINTRIMGNIFTDRFAPNIAVTLTDATTSTATAVIRVMYGVPGSSILPVKIDSAIGSSLTFTDNNLANNTTGYYYIDITNGSSRIVTSPIWYTRSDNLVLPVKLSSFLVQKTDNAVKISWSTEQETNSSYFVVERSANGRNWNNIGTVNAAGNSSIRIDYSIYDNAPMKGINYYRLKLVDKDAKYDYSVTRTALFSTKYAVEVAPNPAKDVVNIYLAKTNNQPATIQLLNAAGKIVYTANSAQSHVQINTTGFGKGLYFVKVIAADDVTTIRVLVQ